MFDLQRGEEKVITGKGGRRESLEPSGGHSALWDDGNCGEENCGSRARCLHSRSQTMRPYWVGGTRLGSSLLTGLTRKEPGGQK